MDGWANALLSQWLGGNNSGPRRAGCKRGSGRRGRRQTSSDYSGPSAAGQVRSGECAGASRPALRRWHECRRQGSPVTICCAWSPPGWVMRFHVINEEKLMFGKQSRWIAPLAATAAVLLAASPAGAACQPKQSGPMSFRPRIRAGPLILVSGHGRRDHIGNPLQQRQPLQSWQGSRPHLVQRMTGEQHGKTYSVNTSGSVSRYVKNPGGKSYTLTLTGHNGFVYFAADRPKEGPGPTCTPDGWCSPLTIRITTTCSPWTPARAKPWTCARASGSQRTPR